MSVNKINAGDMIPKMTINKNKELIENPRYAETYYKEYKSTIPETCGEYLGELISISPPESDGTSLYTFEKNKKKYFEGTTKICIVDKQGPAGGRKRKTRRNKKSKKSRKNRRRSNRRR